MLQFMSIIKSLKYQRPLIKILLKKDWLMIPSDTIMCYEKLIPLCLSLSGGRCSINDSNQLGIIDNYQLRGMFEF